MKKFLALVLALVMTMSLVTISAGAEFTDADSVNYDEAVEVMTAVEVVGGYADGSFNPTAGLTRGAAAKIICNMILGPTTAEALNADAAPFSDVAVDNVFAGYIAYCAKEGIISGYADGTFRPAAPLTGYAFMKMLLGALGYDATNEGYVGANWSINVAKRALNIGLDAGLDGDFVGTKALTREEACLYAFNTLKATMVEYENDSKITVGDIVISNSSKADEVEAASGAADYDATGTTTDATVQFCEKYFKDLAKVAGDDDDFGREASHKWQYDGDDVINVMTTADVVFSAKATADEMAAALKGYKVATKKVNNVNEYADNTALTTYDWVRNTSGSTWTASFGTALKTNEADQTIAERFASLTRNGRLVEFYADDEKNITEIVMVDYKTVEAGKVTTDKKTGDVSYIIDTVTYKDFADEDITDEIVLVDTLEKGDIVTFVKANGKAYVYPTETFEGTQSANKTKDGVTTLTIDGSAYTVGEFYKSGTSFANSADAANYYVDQYGYVVYTDAIEGTASTDYAYIYEVYGKLTETIDGVTPYLQVRAILADGTVGTYDVAIEDDAGTWKLAELGTSLNVGGDVDDLKTSAGLSGVYGYVINGTEITLEAIDALSTTNADESTVYTYTDDISEDDNSYSTSIGSNKVLLTKNTIFVAYDSANKKAAVYTGIENLPEAVSSETAYMVVKSGVDTKATSCNAVVAFMVNTFGADTIEEYVYIDYTAFTTKMNADEQNEKYFEGVKADGTTIELYTPYGKTALDASGLYQYNADNQVVKGDLINLATADDKFLEAAALEVVDDMISVGGTYYYMTADTLVVYVDEDLTEVDGNTGIVVLEKDDSLNVAAIFVTAD